MIILSHKWRDILQMIIAAYSKKLDVIPDSALGLLQLRPHAAQQLHHVRVLTNINRVAKP